MAKNTMLERIRESTKGWFAWMVVGALAVVFTLWGVYGYMGVGAAESQMAVTVNGKDISRGAVERLSQQLQLTAAASGQQGSPEPYREEALEQLIMQTLLIQDAQKHKFIADKPLVDQFLLTQPDFQENGVFSPELFKQIADRNGLDPYELRNIIADEIVVGQLRTGIMASAFVLPSEVERFLTLHNQTRDVQYIVFNADSFEDKREISSDEIKKYYETHKTLFEESEAVSVEYIELTADDAAKGVTVSEEDIRAYYDKNKASYTAVEQRHVRHILLALPPDATTVQMDAVVEQGLEIVEKLKTGNNFATLAAEYSIDVSTVDKGGDLGWVAEGVLPAELDKAVFSAKQNEVIGPTLTPYGMDIVQVIGIKAEQAQPFNTVRNAILSQLKEQRVQQRFVELQDELDSISYEVPDSLQEVSETLQLPIKTTALFTRNKENVDSITRFDNVRAAAFSDAVLSGENSSVLSLGKENVLVLRLKQHQAAQVKPLEQVSPSIVSSIRQQEADKNLEEALEVWVPSLKSGKATRTDVAKQLNAQWKSVPALARNADEKAAPRLVRDYAFNLGRPDTVSTYGWLPLDDEQFAIVAVDRVNQGAVGKEGSADWIAANAGLKMMQQQEDYMVYLEQLRKHASIKYH